MNSGLVSWRISGQCEMTRWTVSTWPYCAARSRGVSPLMLVRRGLACLWVGRRREGRRGEISEGKKPKKSRDEEGGRKKKAGKEERRRVNTACYTS